MKNNSSCHYYVCPKHRLYITPPAGHVNRLDVLSVLRPYRKPTIFSFFAARKRQSPGQGVVAQADSLVPAHAVHSDLDPVGHFHDVHRPGVPGNKPTVWYPRTVVSVCPESVWNLAPDSCGSRIYNRPVSEDESTGKKSPRLGRCTGL
jgi:hypothetical protein